MKDIRDIVLKREIKYWLDRSEYYKKVFSKFYPLIRIVDFASINIPEQEKSDFITGIAGIWFNRNHPKEIDKLLSPVMNRIASIIKSHEYQKAALKTRLKDTSYNKNGLNIPLESDIDKIIRFLPPKEILVTGLEKGTDMAICDYVKYWNDLLSIPTVKPKKQPPEPQQEKPYKSYVRAIAIYYILRNKKKDFKIPVGKKEICSLVKDWKNPETGRPVGKIYFYQIFSVGKNGKNSINNEKQDLEKLYPLDYQYALTLLNAK